MSAPDLQICPSCGMPLDPGASFCGACGAEFRTEGRDAGIPSAEPDARVEAAEDRATRLAHPVAPPPSVATPPPAADAVPRATAFDSAPMRADPSDAVPFALEWDEAREFIERQAGTFSFRVTALWDLAKLGVAATVNEKDLPPAVFSGMRCGAVREGTFDFTPDKPGQVSVRLRVETIPHGLVHEAFVAERVVSHLVRTKDSKSYLGPQTVDQKAVIDNRNDRGLSRNEGQTVTQNVGGETADNWNDQDRVFRRSQFAAVRFAPDDIRRENVLIRAFSNDGLSELLLLPGTDLVTFGTSSRADAGLFVETADGYTDERHTGYVSGFHLSIQRDPKREAFVLRDGGPDRKAATKAAWRKSTNGVAVDGEDLRGEHLLRPGAKLRVCLAPYAVSGGALPLEIETKGWDDPAAAGCEDRRGNLSSLLVRRRDNPRKAILVVWGAAALDPILGTKSGLRAACVGGRLFLVRPDGEATRFHRLAGRTLPNSPFAIA